MEKKLEEALNLMCNEDVVCEVAAVEAVCESILSEAEEEFNSINFYRKKRSADDLLTYFWPAEDHQSGNWVYWKRGDGVVTTTMHRVKRDMLMHDFDDFESKKRRKRQFGFSLDQIFGSDQTTTESPTHSTSQAKDDYLGVLIDIISHSMASDIGFVRFGSFLTSLQSQNGEYTTQEFMTAFSQEFGEEKAAALRELASRKLAGMKITGLMESDSAQNKTQGSQAAFVSSEFVGRANHLSEAQEYVWTTRGSEPGTAGERIIAMQSSSSTGSRDVGSLSYDYDASHSSVVGGGFSKKNLKLQFRVEGELMIYLA